MNRVQAILFLQLHFLQDSHLPSVLDLRNKVLDSYPPSMVHSVRRASFSPISPINIVSHVGNVVDCVQACVRQDQFRSVNFINRAKICIFSDVAVRESHLLTPLTDSIYVTLVFNDEENAPNIRRQIPQLQKPPSCNRNSLGFGSEFTGNEITKRRKRILNGWTPRPYDVPWVGIMFKNERPRCTVALVSKNPKSYQTVWGVTAKHCIVNKDDASNDLQERSELKKFLFVFGIHDIKVSTRNDIVRQAKRIYSTPDEGLCINDLALIKFDKPIKFTGYINGLCLPDNPRQFHLAGDACFVCGWGATQEKKPRRSTDVLKCIQMEARPSDCNRYQKKLILKQSETKFGGPFYGDSGAPIFCRSYLDDQIYFMGIISSGTKSYTVAEPISNFIPWINRLMNRRG